MLLIHRTIVKELLSSFLLSILFLNFALMMEHFLRLSRKLAGIGTSVSDIAIIILYLQPQLFIFSIPMAMLLSVLLTYGRMNTDNELIILRSSGMSFKTLSLPVVYLGLACFAVSTAMSFYLGPKGSKMLREKVSQILTTKAPMTIEEGIFNTAFNGFVILVKEKPSPDRLSEIFIVDERKKEEQNIIIAKEGRIVPEGDSLGFSLISGHIYKINKDMLTKISFGRYNFKLTPSVETMGKRNAELTPAELIKTAKEFPEKRIRLLIEFYKRLSMPAICLLIMLLGPPLSLMAGKSGRMGGLTIGLIIFTVYYALLIYGESLSQAGKLHHFVGAWLPFALLGVFSIYIFRTINKK
ncbi:MAG: LptF/LptG family permease [Thermodesulfovibrionales bacterium]|nr:LptF/LptG family permease [Thermodesulfovibrionales bacterium]